MYKPLTIALCALLLCGVSAPKSSAQLSQLGNALSGKQKKGQEGPADLSTVDKDKIARIEQMPEVQDAIQQEWDDLRKNDMQLAYGINLTENWGCRRTMFPATPLTGSASMAIRRFKATSITSGSSLVPKNSPNVYTFRVLYDPIPKALTLSTGTIYISTGLLSMLDSEVGAGLCAGARNRPR